MKQECVAAIEALMQGKGVNPLAVLELKNVTYVYGQGTPFPQNGGGRRQPFD